MNKRAWERIDVNVDAHICCEPYLFQGRIINISEEGVCIHTTMCFPCETKCTLLIPGNDGMLEVQALVTWLSKRDGFNDTMGFELLKPSTNYVEFINSLRQSL